MKAGFYNTGLKGDYKGYTLSRISQGFFLWIFPKRPIYHCTADPVAPVFFVDRDKRKLTISLESDTDLSSIPPPFDRIVSPSMLELSGIFHDNGCKKKGLWLCNEDGTQVFFPLTRLEMDLLMEQFVEAELELLKASKPYEWFAKHLVFWGVRIGSYLGIGRPKDEDKHPPVAKLDMRRFPVALT